MSNANAADVCELCRHTPPHWRLAANLRDGHGVGECVPPKLVPLTVAVKITMGAIKVASNQTVVRQ